MYDQQEYFRKIYLLQRGHSVCACTLYTVIVERASLYFWSLQSQDMKFPVRMTIFKMPESHLKINKDLANG